MQQIHRTSRLYKSTSTERLTAVEREGADHTKEPGFRSDTSSMENKGKGGILSLFSDIASRVNKLVSLKMDFGLSPISIA
ncbi:UNVERIFIED_CONTAM: hypothetical protein HDU68_010014 [Siphonaria sp. JEL0065]|nr:hypothetical protein HDU68_010014 [Siphonaria sp. JEL0065]